MSEKGFAPVPNEVLRRKDLCPGAKLCLGRLLQYAGNADMAYPKLSTLADDLGLSIRQVQRLLNTLKAEGYIEIQRRGQGLSNMYLIKIELSTGRYDI